MCPEGRTLKQKAYHELKELLIISLYLWIVFGMFVLFKAVVLAQVGHHQVDWVAHGFALINALVLAKFMLIARALNLGHRTEGAPLIYPTLLKSAIYAVVLGLLKILEDATVGYFRGKPFSESIADLGGGSGRAILTLIVILYVILIPLVAVGELNRLLPEGKLAQLFFQPRDAEKPREPQAR
jgi:hypothetical protein